MLVTVDAKELKEMFSDIKPILKSIQEGALVGVSLSDHILTFTVRNGLVYTKTFVVEATGPYSITVLYQDLSEMLPASSTAQLDLEPVFVGVKTKNLNTLLVRANGIISPYASELQGFQKCDTALYTRLANNFTLMSPVSKSLGVESSAILAPDYAILKYSTVWLQIPFNDFTSSISLRDLRSIAAFKPAEVAVSETAVEFKRRTALLAIPRTPLQSTTSVKDVIKDPERPIQLFRSNPLTDIQKFVRSVGSGACVLLFYTDGYEVQVENPRYNCSFRHGDCTQHIYSLHTYLEYLPMLFRIFPMQSAVLTKGSNAIAISEERTTLLHSIV